MDTNRSHEHDEASYSEDFEQDVESQESPISEEKVEIKVFQSAVGSLTVQPKKVIKSCIKINTGRTLSELSLFANKPRSSGLCQQGAQVGTKPMSGTSIGVKINESKTSLVRQGTHNVRRQPLALEKIDPHDVPASASISSLSISRLSEQRNHSGYSRGTPSTNIRRVVAHTSIKEKSYASAKYRTYHNPPIRGNNPPLKIGLAKPNSNIAQRISSAKRMTIMDLKSRIKLLQDEIEKLKKENRFLNHLHHRQDNALKKWEGTNAELPRLLNQHKDEIRSLQEQLRKAQQHSREHNEKLSVRDKKILRLETELDKLRTLVHEEHLQDRHTLQQDLDITRMNLVGAEKRIREYMRHVDILEKNHKHQLVAQEKKLIKVNTHTYELQQVVATLKLALRNKDRMLNYIQMRSSGRSLIRAFHAERGGTDDMFFGSSMSSDLNRAYQPPPLMKSHSFDFPNSRCATPSLEEKRDYDFLYNRRRSDEYKNNHNQNRNKSNYDENSISRSRPMSRLSHSLESILAPRISSPVEQEKKRESIDKKSNSTLPSHEKQVSDNSDRKSKAVKSILKNSKKAEDNNEDKRKSKSEKYNYQKQKVSSQKSIDRKTKKKEIQKPKLACQDEDKSYFEKADPPESVDSKELVYRGSSTGFKYEGPFVTSNQTLNQDSTEVLYSPKSDKHSEHSLTISETSTSSRSEILSNIDILSARIRESCVLVPPPEETLKSTTFSNPNSNTFGDNGPPGSSSTNYVGLRTSMGPGGDNSSSATLMLTNAGQIASPRREELLQATSTSYQAGILQPIQLYTNANQQEYHDASSPTSNQSFMSASPRIFNVAIPNVATTVQNVQSPQFQLAQPTSTSSNMGYITTNNSDSCNSIIQSHLTTGDQTARSQIIENSTIQYTPRMPQEYSAFNTVSVVGDPQGMMNGVHQGAQQQTMQCQSRFPYFSYTASQDIQQPQPTNVTIIQTNPVYEQLMTPRNTNTTMSPRSQMQTFFAAPPKSSNFPQVGYYNSKPPDSECETTFPNISNNPNNNNNKTNQSGYNPGYYVNLGNWK